MKKLLSLTLSISILFNVSAQSIEKEAQYIVEGYISPLAISLGTALNNGWYNTAKPHKLGGFDVTFTANFVLIPDEAKTFNITEKGGAYFTGEETATIFGEDGGEITYTDVWGGEESSTMPPGLAIPIIPIPMLQAGIGLIKGSEINIRYFPKKESSAGEVSLFGIGVKHDVLQWLPIVDKIPLTVSVQAGYTQLDYKKEPILDGRTAKLNLSATTFNLILSKKLLMFTPYIGVGYNSTGSNFSLDDYRIGSVEIDGEWFEEVTIESYNEPKINVGFRFNITVLALQANYTFSKYPVATLGAGISLR